MRFGKRNKNLLLMGWRAKKGPEESPLMPVASGERSALLSNPTNPPEQPGGEAPPDEATQRLLTTLGRFHRQVVRAREGIPPELWCDECMNQLIAAVEVALAKSCSDVVEVLTETARILQTYEDAGQAASCVPFLSDAYEILCLMVGDLIVGSIRPAVMQKWLYCYRQAVEELEATGLELVRDDGEPGPADADAMGRAGQLESAEYATEVPEEASPFEIPSPEAMAGEPREEDLPTLASLPPLKGDAELGEEPIGEESPGKAWSSDADTGDDGSAATPRAESVAPELYPIQEKLMPLAPLEEEGAGAEAQTWGSGDEGENGADAAAAEVVAPPEVVQWLDRLCEGLSRLEKGLDSDSRSAFTKIAAALSYLEGHAKDQGRLGAVQACQALWRLYQIIQEGEAAPDDRFFGLAYAFCGVYVDAQVNPDDAGTGNWISECETLIDNWAQGHAEQSETPALPDRDGVSPRELLATAQEAVARGQTADAKCLALQAAAGIARAEAAEAEARLSEAEQRLQKGAGAIERARSDVQGAEKEVLETEGHVGEEESALAERRTRTAQIQATLDEITDKISEIDGEIRELQARRDNEAERLAESEPELEEAQRQEAQAQEELTTLKATEETARIKLEEFRQHIKNLERKRGEIETAMEKARDILTRQRTALADIEETIAHVRTEHSGGPTDAGELLF